MPGPRHCRVHAEASGAAWAASRKRREQRTLPSLLHIIRVGTALLPRLLQTPRFDARIFREHQRYHLTAPLHLHGRESFTRCSSGARASRRPRDHRLAKPTTDCTTRSPPPTVTGKRAPFSDVSFGYSAEMNLHPERVRARLPLRTARCPSIAGLTDRESHSVGRRIDCRRRRAAGPG